MTVYEATTREHLEKIAAFLTRQPDTSVWVQCFKGLIAQNTVEYIEFLKQQKPRLHIFVNEDDGGVIKAIELYETRGEYPGEPKIATNVLPFWEDADRKKEYKYVLELLKAVGKHLEEQGYEFVEGIVSEADFQLLDAFPNQIVVTMEHEVKQPPLGKIRRYRYYPKGVPK